MTPTATEIGDLLGKTIMATMADAQNNSARSQQSDKRVLGMSELGGCREYIRATVAGDPKTPEVGLKWAAFVGTALGDFMENALAAADDTVITQRRLTLELKSGIRVSGSADAIFPTAIIDFKSKDTLAWVRRDGPTFKEKAQISGYLIAGVQDNTIPEGSTGHLVYIDRSGKDKTTHVWSTSHEQAIRLMEIVEERLEDVAKALSTGGKAPRDEPESYCWAIQCGFYQACWGGYMPTGRIDHPRMVAAVAKYTTGRDDLKAAKAIMEDARVELRGDPERNHELANGVTPTGTSVQFSLVSGRNGDFEKLDVRERKSPAPKTAKPKEN